jgi:hypothetical protein
MQCHPPPPPGSQYCFLCPQALEEDAMYHTFFVLVVGSHGRCLCHVAKPHFTSRTVPKIHQQTKNCSRIHVNMECKSWSVRFREATDGWAPSLIRTLCGGSPRRILTEATGPLRSRPGCGDAGKAGSSRQKAQVAVGKRQRLQISGQSNRSLGTWHRMG